MARTTKSLSGGGKDKLLRALVGAESDIASMTAERLLQRLSETITEVRVKRDAWETLAKAPAASKVATAAVPRRPATAPVPPPAATPTTFDPFAFSALALLTKKGKAGLADALATISAAEHLHALAAAQHLAVDRSEMDVAALRAAIVAATEARLKERRAAAS